MKRRVGSRKPDREPGRWKRAGGMLLNMALELRTDCILCTGYDGSARESARVSII